MRKTLLAGAVIGAALLVPASAFGSTASSSATEIEVRGTGNEVNRILVRFDSVSGDYVITDSAGITANPACVQVNSTTVTCPGVGVTRLEADAGNRNDSVTLDAATIPAALRTSLDGGQGKDVLLGADSADAIEGGPGADSLDGRKGADAYSGGSGTDSVSYTTNPGGVTVTIGFGTGDDGNVNDATGAARDTVGADVEAIHGSPSGDSIRGDSSNETLRGLGGADFVHGRGGADKVVGGAGDDRVIGGSGRDRVIGKAGVDVLKGKGGIDRLKARDGTRDAKINCGKGKNKFEVAKTDRRDPKPKKC